jgi:16S rRNA (uracil1498-N3)-methyltransferase
MNRVLLREQVGELVLPVQDSRFEHVRGVLRLKEGDAFDVGVINGPVGKATITTIGSHTLVAQCVWGSIPPPCPATGLIIGLSRPAVMKRLLVLLPTLGVRWIRVVAAGRSDPAYARSRLWQDRGWESYLIEGVEQAFHGTLVPEVRIFDDIRWAAKVVDAGAVCLALDNYEATTGLEAGVAGRPPESVAWLAVGPERGWNGPDRKALRAAGFTLVDAGERVLKVETAVTVGIYALNRQAAD